MSTPTATTAERAILGSIMRKPSLLADVLERLSPEQFACPYAGALLELMRSRASEGRGVDAISICEAVAMLGTTKLPAASEVMRYPDDVPSTAALPAWIGEVTNAATLRDVLALSAWLSDECETGKTGVDILDRAGSALQRIATKADHGDGPVMLGDAAASELPELLSPSAQAAPMSTGLDELDSMLGGGLRRQELTVIGGRPGMGKTALAVCMADHATIHSRSVLMFSAEMSTGQVTQRLLSSWTSIPFGRIRQPSMLTPPERDLLKTHAADMRAASFAIDDRAAPSLVQIEATSRRHKLRHGLDLVVVDYFQILGIEERNGRRLEGLNAMANGLMQMAKRLDCSVVLLSQLNRNLTNRQDKLPILADLKECGALEEAAHVVLFPYRPAVDDEAAPVDLATIRIAKQRSGPTGDISAVWDGPRLCFKNDSDADLFGIDGGAA